MFRVFPTLTANKTQATAYLLGVAFFSISFLVFLNASISFVVTDVIGQKHGVGNTVGTLGFADELLALVACPLWGLISDRVGVRTVAVTGYIIIGISLICLVQSHNVYPELLLARLGFSVGGAACSTMVTAILPAMTAERETSQDDSDRNQRGRLNASAVSQGNNNRHSVALSTSSDLTITPARYESRSEPSMLSRLLRTQTTRNSTSSSKDATMNSMPRTSQLAGFVGLFTGLGALLAVGVFLPLPASFAGNGTPQDEAVKESFYIVGGIAIVVGILVYFGLSGLPGEEAKGFRNLFDLQDPSQPKEDPMEGRSSECSSEPVPSYLELIGSAIKLGFTDSNIALGYVGGFVARASSVGISLFVPLFVNAYFIREGLCTDDPAEDIKANCRRAYTLASMLTGISQLVALLSAPLFGWFNGQMSNRDSMSNIPLAIGAAVGIVGCVGFGLLDSPDPFSEDSRGKWAILAVILLGISQISAIVCSLGILARGIQSTAAAAASNGSRRPQTSGTRRTTAANNAPPIEPAEVAPLLPSRGDDDQAAGSSPSNRTHLKGTIAGVYSLGGGAGILLLTKLGGFLFDRTSPGAPFFMLAIFNAVLLVAIGGITAGQRLRPESSGAEDDADTDA